MVYAIMLDRSKHHALIIIFNLVHRKRGYLNSDLPAGGVHLERQALQLRYQTHQ